MSLWAWASAAYAREGVAEACLALQDEHGQNVPFLLWAAWAGEPAALKDAARLAREWEASVVGPLRGVRGALKGRGHNALREAVKASELSAERALLEALERLCPRAGGEALAALEAASRAWGRPAPRPALERLAAALS